MQKNLEELMSQKTGSELMMYITNIHLYSSESISAAMNELKKRGKEFTDEEREDIEAKIKARLAKEKSKAGNSWKKNIVTDPDAPQYYSPQAIWGFSIFFTVIVGAILMAINIEDKKAKWVIVVFGLLYTAAAIFILNQLPASTGLTLGVNALGALIMTQVFWNKYIGKDTKFRTKPIWIPLIVSILLTIPLLLAIIYGSEE